jgi:exonuclease-1
LKQNNLGIPTGEIFLLLFLSLIPSTFQIIFKLDKHGNGKEIRLSDLGASKELDFVNFTSQMLRHMCILSGCDYIDSITGLGPKKAHAFIKKFRDINKVKKLQFSEFPIYLL